MLGERIQQVRNRRQEAIIELVAQGLTNRDVARELGTTEYVIKNYLRAIYDKLGLWNRVELALWYEARKHENRRSGEAASLTGIRDSATIPPPEVN
jgi:DNA-binding NarL/FixJ family response regulator